MATAFTYVAQETGHGLDIIKSNTRKKVGHITKGEDKLWFVSFPDVKPLSRVFGDRDTAKAYAEGISAAVAVIGSEIFEPGGKQ